LRDVFIAGRTFALAGSFTRFSGDEIARAISRAGGVVEREARGRYEVLVAGEGVDPRVLAARERGVAAVSEDRAAGMFQLGFDLARRRSAVEATLARPRDGLRWRRLCELLDLWPDDDTLAAMLERVRTLVAAWPDAECEAPAHWVRRAVEGAADPRLRVPRRWCVDGDLAEARALLLGTDAPTVRQLAVTHARARAADLPALVAAAVRAGLHALDLWGNLLGADAAAYIAGEPSLAGLDALTLAENPLGDEGLRVLSGARHLTSVHALDLRGCRVGPDGLDALADSPWLVRIESLDLSDNPLGVRSGASLAASETLASVQRLSLAGCGLLNGGVRALARTANLHEVQTLDLSRCGVGDEGFAALVDGALIETVTSLRCAGDAAGQVGARGVAALTQSDRLGTLSALDLSGNPFDDATLAALLTARRLPQLRELRLDGPSAVTSHALEILCDQEPVPKLRVLSLPACDLRKVRKEVWRGARFLDGVEHLALRDARVSLTSLRALLSHAPLVAVRSMCLRGTVIGDDGLDAVLRAPRLALLRELDASRCGLGPRAVDAILGSGRMDRLERLTVSRDELAPHGLPRLLAGQRFPGQVVLAG
jgi:hypothetical protein